MVFVNASSAGPSRSSSHSRSYRAIWWCRARILVLTVVALWFVPRRNAGTWVGVLAVVGSPSLHVFGMLFMVPAWLAIRREMAFIAGFFIGTFTEPGVWIAVALVAVAWTLGATRWPWLLEPATAPVSAAGSGALGEPLAEQGHDGGLDREILAPGG